MENGIDEAIGGKGGRDGAGVRNSAFRRREKKERGRCCGKVFHVDKRAGENWWKSVSHDRKI